MRQIIFFSEAPPFIPDFSGSSRRPSFCFVFILLYVFASTPHGYKPSSTNFILLIQNLSIRTWSYWLSCSDWILYTRYRKFYDDEAQALLFSNISLDLYTLFALTSQIMQFTRVRPNFTKIKKKKTHNEYFLLNYSRLAYPDNRYTRLTPDTYKA